MLQNINDIRDSIRKNYAEVAQKGASCCAGSCCCAPADGSIAEGELSALSARIGYSESELANVPQNANMGLGCGNPTAIASLKKGDVVLDLGSGGGFDCFLAREKVSESGLVIGVDMTPDMISLARKNAEKIGVTNVEFRLGEIEHLPVADICVDVIISNCVINLSLEKEQVFKEAFRVLKNGGRLVLSDICATAELPEQIKNDLAMISGCIAGAEHIDRIEAMLKRTGFSDIKLTQKGDSRELLASWSDSKNLSDYVASFVIEATKQ